jgi:hypothetical protein
VGPRCPGNLDALLQINLTFLEVARQAPGASEGACPVTIGTGGGESDLFGVALERYVTAALNGSAVLLHVKSTDDQPEMTVKMALGKHPLSAAAVNRYAGDGAEIVNHRSTKVNVDVACGDTIMVDFRADSDVKMTVFQNDEPLND